MTGNFFWGGGVGGVKFWSKDLSGFCLKPLGFDFCPCSIIPVDHPCHLKSGVSSWESNSLNTYIHANSPGLSGSLLLSRTGHQISRMKSSFELFCALVCDLAHF